MLQPVFAPMASGPPDCVLCTSAGGTLVWQDADWRVIRADEADFPAFYRVVLQRHVSEWSGLDAAGRERCMALVVAVEQVLISMLRPTKVNLAALGNAVPHLHWHVIARFDWDSHFPQPVWAARVRQVDGPATARLAVTLQALDTAVTEALARA